MVTLTILAGGFSSFIATYIFNSDAATLTLTKNTTTGTNPSWIASHPKNKSILYAVNEIEPVGNLQSFLVQPDGGLTLVDTVATGGIGPTFSNPLSTGEVTAMNFGSPNCSFIATDPSDPTRFLPSPVVEFPVNGGSSHPHMSLEFNGEVFVPDLGADKIWRLVNDGSPGKFKVQGQIDFAPGNGPRHIAIRDGILFTVHEKTSRLTVQQLSQGLNDTTLPLIANVSIIPPSPSANAPFNATFAAAELLISDPSEQFPDPLIYVSNRNLGPDFDPRGDSIAIFEFKQANSSTTPSSGGEPADPNATDIPTSTLIRRRLHAKHFSLREVDPGADPISGINGTLELQNQVFTGLRQIRSMALGPVDGDGSDEFLVAGANLDGGVAVFKRTQGGRNLEVVARNTDLPSRTSFVFI